MNAKRLALLATATATAAVGAFAGPAATPASASCTTVIILGEKTCFESIPCELRDAAAAQNERVQALVSKYGAYDCIQ